ncbi:MAG: hypothetical protein HY000_05485 [Planctomycetes bacterium]|nr:hypothetical protein [Planctomycetota bacterium]
MRVLLAACFAVVSLKCAAPAVPEDVTPIDSEQARAIAARLVQEANKFDKPQIKIDADPQKANGVHSPDKLGIMVVPQKDLKESEELSAKFKTEKGASLAYLFMYHVVPVIDGKPVETSQLRSVKLIGDNGTEHIVYVLLLAVRQPADDDYRLHAYGHLDKPLVDAKFAEVSASGPEPVACDIKEPNDQTKQGKLVVTVFGKYQASFQCGYKAD